MLYRKARKLQHKHTNLYIQHVYARITIITSNSSADETANVNFVYDDIAHVEYSTRRRQTVSVDHRYIYRYFLVWTYCRDIVGQKSYCTTTVYK